MQIETAPLIENVDFDNWMRKFVRLFNDRDHINYTPSAIDMKAGSETGTVTNVQTLFDGNTLDIAEVAATPGFNVEFDFTNIVLIPQKIQLRLRYSGLSTHGVGVDLYNYDGSTWDRFTHFTDHETDDYAWIEVTVPDMSNYRDSSSNMTLRLYHYSAGNDAHDLYIDYVSLRT